MKEIFPETNSAEVRGWFWDDSHAYFREGNGTPLQCSCLENPRDGGTWWAAIYGVSQSRTRLKQLSSSSNRIFIVHFTSIIVNIVIYNEITVQLTIIQNQWWEP